MCNFVLFFHQPAPQDNVNEVVQTRVLKPASFSKDFRFTKELIRCFKLFTIRNDFTFFNPATVTAGALYSRKGEDFSTSHDN